VLSDDSSARAGRDERGFVRLALGDEEAFAFIDLDLR